MHDKSKMKKELLETLKSVMKEIRAEEKMGSMKESLGESMMPEGIMDALSGEDMPKTQVTVAGDSPEAVKEGLSKAEQIMEAKFGKKKDKKK